MILELILREVCEVTVFHSEKLQWKKGSSLEFIVIKQFELIQLVPYP